MASVLACPGLSVALYIIHRSSYGISCVGPIDQASIFRLKRVDFNLDTQDNLLLSVIYLFFTFLFFLLH